MLFYVILCHTDLSPLLSCSQTESLEDKMSRCTTETQMAESFAGAVTRCSVTG